MARNKSSDIGENLVGGLNFGTEQPKKADTEKEVKRIPKKNVSKGRPKTKTGHYKKVNVSIEENDLQLYKALAYKRCGGNLTLLINQLLKEAVEKDN